VVADTRSHPDNRTARTGAVRYLPEVAVKPRPEDEPRYVQSYVFTRLAIGLLGVLLPLVLVPRADALRRAAGSPWFPERVLLTPGCARSLSEHSGRSAYSSSCTSSRTSRGKASLARWPELPPSWSPSSRPSGPATA
jgi:hypothetical protein